MKICALCALAGLALSASLSRAEGADEGGYEVIANAYGFACEIPGCVEASKNIRKNITVRL